MVSDLFFYELLLLGLPWLWVMLHYAWLSNRPAGEQRTSKPAKPPHQRSREPSPFPPSSTGLTVQPVSRRHRNQRPRHLPPRRQRPSLAGDAHARWRPPSISAPIRTMRIRAG
jgi:hypothetical protein